MVSAVLDYAPPERPRCARVLRMTIILIIAAGAAVGAAIGDWLQPDLFIFDGSLFVSASGTGTDVATAKRAHLATIPGGIPAAVAALNAQGIRMSAAEFGNRLTLTNVPQTQLISIRCSSRSFNKPLAMVNALIIPYCNNNPGVMMRPGTLRRIPLTVDRTFHAAVRRQDCMLALAEAADDAIANKNKRLAPNIARRMRRGFPLVELQIPSTRCR